MAVSFGSASGPVENFNLGVLSAKGSLFVTRPTLMTYTRTRELLLACASDLIRGRGLGCRQDRDPPALPAGARPPSAHRALEGRATTGSTLLIP